MTEAVAVAYLHHKAFAQADFTACATPCWTPEKVSLITVLVSMFYGFSPFLLRIWVLHAYPSRCVILVKYVEMHVILMDPGP